MSAGICSHGSANGMYSIPYIAIQTKFPKGPGSAMLNIPSEVPQRETFSGILTTMWVAYSQRLQQSLTRQALYSLFWTIPFCLRWCFVGFFSTSQLLLFSLYNVQLAVESISMGSGETTLLWIWSRVELHCRGGGWEERDRNAWTQLHCHLQMDICSVLFVITKTQFKKDTQSGLTCLQLASMQNFKSSLRGWKTIKVPCNRHLMDWNRTHSSSQQNLCMQD